MPESTTKPARLYFIDNIRWFVIVQVVVLHAAVTYSNLGKWYYLEPAELSPLSGLAFGIILSFTQAYSLGLLFLVAGYFVPPSFDRKGARKFLRDRAVRLGIPALIYMLFVNPAIIYYLLAFRWTTPRPPADQYFLGYILSLDFLGGSGPMWFALALLFFSAAYAAARLLRGDQEKKDEEAAEEEAKLPRHRDVVALALIIAAAAFTVRLVQPIGTAVLKTARILRLLRRPLRCGDRRPPEALAPPHPLFLRDGVAQGRPGRRTAFWLALFLFGIGPEGDISKTYGGLTWQSAAYALWEAFFCLAACLGIVVIFRERFDSSGRFARFMADNSFAVYFFLPVILILVTASFRGFAWHPLVKFAVAAAVAVPLCFVASELVLRRIPVLGRVLWKVDILPWLREK